MRLRCSREAAIHCCFASRFWSCSPCSSSSMTTMPCFIYVLTTVLVLGTLAISPGCHTPLPGLAYSNRHTFGVCTAMLLCVANRCIFHTMLFFRPGCPRHWKYLLEPFCWHVLACSFEILQCEKIAQPELPISFRFTASFYWRRRGDMCKRYVLCTFGWGKRSMECPGKHNFCLAFVVWKLYVKI